MAEEGGWQRVNNGGGGREGEDDDDTAAANDDDDGDDDDAVKEAPRWAVAAALFALHAAAAGCAVQLESLQLALDIIGATCGVLITFILPGRVGTFHHVILSAVRSVQLVSRLGAIAPVH